MASRWGCCLTEADQDRLIHRAGIGDTGSTRDLLHTTRGIVASLDGQVVLVTGATDGLGRALAVSLAEAGATVLIHGRDAGRITATTEDVRAMSGSDQVRSYQADLSVLDQVRTLAAQVTEAEPRLDVLVNNAGIGSTVPGDGARQESSHGYELP